ncbi:MAG: sulfate permease [bacterium]|nr:MAG: sulfate permease [bacterium]
MVVAIILALVQLMILASRPHDAILGRIRGTDVFRDIRNAPEAETFPGLLIYRFEASLVFFNADHFKSRVQGVIREAVIPVTHFLIDAEGINHLDTTGADCLARLRDELEASGIVLCVAEARSPVHAMLDRTGLAARIGTERIFPTVAEATRTLSGV